MIRNVLSHIIDSPAETWGGAVAIVAKVGSGKYSEALQISRTTLGNQNRMNAVLDLCHRDEVVALYEILGEFLAATAPTKEEAPNAS